jgi:hypothetical protein
VIISPHFASNSSEGCHDKLAANEINWSCEGWRMGGDANGNSTLSTYDVIDRILTLLSRRDVFPNLRHVVLAGHSAGGVFVYVYVYSITKLVKIRVIAMTLSLVVISANRVLATTMICSKEHRACTASTWST